MTRILIIEDDVLIAKLEKDYFRAEGWEADCVEDGFSAISQFEKQEYQAVVLDLMLPGKDGYEICREIRRKSKVPVVMVTARKEEIDKILGLGLGTDAYRVYKDDREVDLTSREFELFLFLAQNPNIVFSKEKLFDRVWGMDAIGDLATVAVHINKLREKIEDHPSEPRLIQTVWGVGYRFQIM